MNSQLTIQRGKKIEKNRLGVLVYSLLSQSFFFRNSYLEYGKMNPNDGQFNIREENLKNRFGGSTV